MDDSLCRWLLRRTHEHYCGALSTFVFFSLIKNIHYIQNTHVQVPGPLFPTHVIKGSIRLVLHIWENELSALFPCNTCVRFFLTICENYAYYSVETTTSRKLWRLPHGCGGLSTDIFAENSLHVNVAIIDKGRKIHM